MLALALLAAGASTRLGQPKQLVRFGGKTLLRRAAETALALPESPVAVVLGAGFGSCRDALQGLKITLLENGEWPEGMASSVRQAAGWATEIGADALLLLLCDQPLVTPPLLNELAGIWQTTAAPIVACRYDAHTTGVPVLFDRALFAALLGLRGDRGAQALLRQYPSAVATVPFAEGRFDLDTPADLLRLGELEKIFFLT